MQVLTVEYATALIQLLFGRQDTHLLCVRMCLRIRLNLSEVPAELGKAESNEGGVRVGSRTRFLSQSSSGRMLGLQTTREKLSRRTQLQGTLGVTQLALSQDREVGHGA